MLQRLFLYTSSDDHSRSLADDYKISKLYHLRNWFRSSQRRDLCWREFNHKMVRCRYRRNSCRSVKVRRSFHTPSITVSTTFYAEAVNLNGCIAAARVAVQANLNLAIPVATVGTFVNTKCDASSFTLIASTSSEATIKWYDAETGGTLLKEEASNCNGASVRTAVPVTVIETPSITAAPGITTCQFSNVTLTATASAGTLNWYDVPTGGSPNIALATINNISLTTTRYVSASLTINGVTCESPRTAVTVKMLAGPSITSASGNQTVYGANTVSLNASGPTFDGLSNTFAMTNQENVAIKATGLSRLSTTTDWVWQRSDNGGITWTNVTASLDAGVTFDGVDDHVYIGQPASIQAISNSITVEAWINPSSWSNHWYGNFNVPQGCMINGEVEELDTYSGGCEGVFYGYNADYDDYGFYKYYDWGLSPATPCIDKKAVISFTVFVTDIKKVAEIKADLGTTSTINGIKLAGLSGLKDGVTTVNPNLKVDIESSTDDTNWTRQISSIPDLAVNGQTLALNEVNARYIRLRKEDQASNAYFGLSELSFLVVDMQLSLISKKHYLLRTIYYQQLPMPFLEKRLLHTSGAQVRVLWMGHLLISRMVDLFPGQPQPIL
ncbi:hypothetical protein GHT06_003542 [Daphnia sinensis]|uniref:Ig-like domain-containing protein n=1 Tax=Daphnia sinensis TaxID=1820382 RepID=A0AAD5PP09_9CRUS|nr:hypothetical protein GHT06_003542 [Daphnia sinensis]